MSKQKSKARKIVSNSVTFGLLGVFVALIVYAIVCFSTGRILSLFGYGFSSVKTGSMKPVIEPQSVVLIKMVDGEDYSFTVGENGDIAVYEGTVAGNDAYILHRVVEENSDGTITTKGDANSTADTPIERSAVKGIYVKTLPGLTKLSRMLATGAGLVFLVLIPCVGLVVCHLITAVKSASVLQAQKERSSREEELKRQAIEEFLRSQNDKSSQEVDTTKTE